MNFSDCSTAHNWEKKKTKQKNKKMIYLYYKVPPHDISYEWFPETTFD